ncbi:abscisic acid receptor PYL4-like protein [Tanacetum coccineum]
MPSSIQFERIQDNNPKTAVNHHHISATTANTTWKFPPPTIYLPENLHHYHTHAISHNQCSSTITQIISAPLDTVWSIIRQFDNPQSYKHFLKSCHLIIGDGNVGSIREVQVISGLPAGWSMERLEILDEENHVMSFKVVGGEHRLRNYRSVTTLHSSPTCDGTTVVVESYVVDVPPENTKEETCVFVETIAKVRWAIEGDENSKYFHAIINKKRANLSVKGVMVDGDWIDDPFQFWTIVGSDFCTVVKWFFDHGDFAIGCNSLFVALIPKVLDLKVVNDYRPISLIGFGAKWRSWIRGSLSSGKASILVNGSPTPDFHLHRGIKIDPTITLSHLFYADDAVFIGEWSQANLKGIMHILQCFSLLSGDSRLKKFSGLGVLSFFGAHRALFQVGWRYLSQDNSLWFRVIAAIHGSTIHLLSAAYNSIWSSIIKEVKFLKDKGIDLISHCKIRVGNGTSARNFWNDVWDWAFLLKLLPLVSCFRKKSGPSDADKNNASINYLSFSSPYPEGVKDVRNLLDEAFLPKVDVPTRWIKSILIKCGDVLKLICRWWDLDFHDVDSYDGWLFWFKSIRLGSKSKDVLEGVFYVFWWRLWYYRNELLFAEQPNSAISIEPRAGLGTGRAGRRPRASNTWGHQI